MDLEVALDLLQHFLEKRGVDCIKQLSGLVALGRVKGYFQNPDSIFDVAEWRRLGDVLWGMVIDEDKSVKKLMKPWCEIVTNIKRYQLEKNLAAVAMEQLGGAEATAGLLTFGGNHIPVPAMGCPIPVHHEAKELSTEPPPIPPRSNVTTAEPSAPPPSEEEEMKPVRFQNKPKENDEEVTTPTPMSCPRVTPVNWRRIIRQAVEEKQLDVASNISESFAFPVKYDVGNDGNLEGMHQSLDWKLLSQLRTTVNESGIHGEPTKQLLNYIWGGTILCPEDIKGIIRMIMTQSQQLLRQAHWQQYCEVSAHQLRQQGDGLWGVTVEQLMGTDRYASVDMQIQQGPDVCSESMRTARLVIAEVKTSPPSPSYRSIKQGRDETFSQFVDRVTSAIDQSDVQEWMKGALLRQCVMENTNPSTKSIILTLPGDATIEQMLDRMSRVPVSPQAMLVEAVRELGKDLIQAQQQAFVALAPLKQSETQPRLTMQRGNKCFRCGQEGHIRRQCWAQQVWCETAT
ncbi:RIB43A-like with coiled-coils protein 2 isoform X1 [Patagioenas fasciata]|uniref:RIB43A-like with coiled-coils protein 2 isoform X1 n=1 Tax=Patagioenas fasciata TaxID=372321 RepID=UPI003A99BEF7